MELLRVALWNHGMDANLTILNLTLEYARLHQQPRQHRTLLSNGHHTCFLLSDCFTGP